MIEPGQLRRWVRGAGEVGRVFLVIGFTKVENHRDTTVDYIMDGELCWDDFEWIEMYSEVISES